MVGKNRRIIRKILEGSRILSSKIHDDLRFLSRTYWAKKRANLACPDSNFRQGDVGEFALFYATNVEPNNEDNPQAVDGRHPDGLVEVKTDFTKWGDRTHLVDKTSRHSHEYKLDGPWRAVEQGAKFIVFVHLPDTIDYARGSVFVYDAVEFKKRCEDLVSRKAYKHAKTTYGNDKRDGRGSPKGIQYSVFVKDFRDLRLPLNVLD